MNRKLFLRSIATTGLGAILANNSAFGSTTDEVSLKSPNIIPPYLKPGDTVGITCPAGAVDAAQLHACTTAMEKWGLNIKLGKTVGKRWQRFGGTDKERLQDLQELIDDENVKAIIFGKGGYGTMRIIDQVRWDRFVKQPKWLVGYSDLTVVHLHLHSNLNVCTIHGAMTGGFSDDPMDAATSSLSNALFGTKTEYSIGSFEMNRIGRAQGKLVGGNLTMINACTASKSDINTKGKILFIEDVSEFKYNIDRMMMTLKRAGKLDKLAGLIVGQFTAIRNDEEASFDMRVEEIIWEKVKEYDYPVCFHFPAGHVTDNRALKMGVNYDFYVGRDTVRLTEITPTVTPAPVVSVNNIFVK